MARNINDFISKFDGGAKPNLFRVTIYPSGIIPVPSLTNPNLMSNDKNKGALVFMAKGAQLPESTVGEILVPFLGRQIKVPGDRTYADWSVTIMNTEEMELRKEFERWNQAINGHLSNIATGNVYEWTRFSAAKIEQLKRNGRVAHTYDIYGIFPREISPIDMAFDQNDAVSEFTVTFAYTYHIPQI